MFWAITHEKAARPRPVSFEMQAKVCGRMTAVDRFFYQPFEDARMRTEKRTTLSEVVRGTIQPCAWRWLSLAMALLLLAGVSAYGQFESASVLGYVRDSSGAAIPNSTVTLANKLSTAQMLDSSRGRLHTSGDA